MSDSCDLSLPRGADGQSAFLYIAYASDASGANFTMTFNASLDWEAHLNTNTQIQTPAVGDFTDLWYNKKGDTGADGDSTEAPIRTVTASTSANKDTDGTIIVNVAGLSGTCEVTLPDASTCNKKKFVINPINAPTGTPYNVELKSVSDIDGSSSNYVVGFNWQYGYIFVKVVVQSDGTEYHVISRNLIDPREKFTAAVD